MAQHRCPSCGASVTALVTEEVIRAAGKPRRQGGKIKALKTERNQLRTEAMALKAQVSERDAQLLAARAEAQALRAASAGGAAGGAGAKSATEEAAVPVRVSKKGEGKRIVQMTPSQIRTRDLMGRTLAAGRP
jgi:hypothetical protein